MLQKPSQRASQQPQHVVTAKLRHKLHEELAVAAVLWQELHEEHEADASTAGESKKEQHKLEEQAWEEALTVVKLRAKLGLAKPAPERFPLLTAFARRSARARQAAHSWHRA